LQRISIDEKLVNFIGAQSSFPDGNIINITIPSPDRVGIPPNDEKVI